LTQNTHPVLQCDLLVVGGGINGVGIARDAAGRGLSVVLCEQDDLAAHTSSASSKLIHGGLRYLEHGEFGLVRKALREREVLLRSAPHIIQPLRFVLPHSAGQRPAWLMRAGLFLYDRLARREILPGSDGIALRAHPAGAPLKPEFTLGFEYSDGWVDDARLVVLNALDAAQKGARILVRTRCLSARREGQYWLAELQDGEGAALQVHARAMVNAAGPWAAQFLQRTGAGATPALRLVKGSHIVVRGLFDHRFAYIFQHPDRRIVFAIPFQQDFTLIGTTDVTYQGDPAAVAIDEDEIAYLCELANRYFRRPLTASDVVWSYSGVRPLVEDEADDPSAITRDYRLDLDRQGPPLLSVFGGKITTYRKLAEEALDLLAKPLGCNAGGWTAGAVLPGGDLGAGGAVAGHVHVDRFEHFLDCARMRYAHLPAPLLARWARSYGTLIHTLLAGRDTEQDLGEQLLPGLYEAEIDYLVRHEWAMTARDILWRRTKLGLHLPQDAEQRLDAWLGMRQTPAAH